MIAARGKEAVEMSGDELNELTSGYASVALDLGTGDGRFAYSYAAENPDAFVIGMDPVREALREFSTRARRKPARGGLPNLLYIVASIEQPPPELAGRCNQIFINLPWGSLMRGIIEADDTVLGNLANLAAGNACLRIILNTRVFDDPVPLDVQGLPEVTVHFAETVLAAAFSRHGFTLTEARFLAPEELIDLATSWAKRLSHRSPPPSFLIEARKNANPR
jgi:16S rRNA (adenine(1408)-N(1))-methyltransferase